MNSGSPHNPDTTRGWFITGTDTGVGKTVVTAALACHLRRRRIFAGIMKPIETGRLPGGSTDAERLMEAAASDDPLNLVNPYRFDAPLAPLAAARQAGIEIDLERIAALCRELSFRHACLLVEGVGGVRVPITDHADVRDLIWRLRLPALVVGRAALGGVNHALMTIDALTQAGIAVVGVVLNQPQSAPNHDGWAQTESTVALIRERSLAPVFGPLPCVPSLEHRWMEGITRVAHDPAIAALAAMLIPAS